jgi:hypothetical protein
MEGKRKALIAEGAAQQENMFSIRRVVGSIPSTKETKTVFYALIK